MPVGFPDWGQYAPRDVAIPSFDIAELAARLGSPSVFDRGGRALFLEDFGAGFSRCYKVAATAGRVQPTARVSLFGGYSLQFWHEGASAPIPAIAVTLPFVSTTPVGLEAGICLTTTDAVCRFEVDAYVSGELRLFRMIYNRSTGVVGITREDGTSVNVASGVYVPTGKGKWSMVKLIVDPIGGKYTRAKINSKEFDLSSYGAQKSSSGNPDELTAIIGLGIAASYSGSNYLGYVIITDKE